VSPATSPRVPRHPFQVDLHGVVDLFARHLYSSPRVYLRELLQNAVDALTARRLLEPDCPGLVRLSAWGGDGLQVRDTGIGLTRDEADDLLATIGRSSKRLDDLETARADYIGQFGIGLLSAFMVAEEVELWSRSARDPAAAPVRWVGRADGTYTLDEVGQDEYGDVVPGAEPGSVVRLRPRIDQAHWLNLETVQALASDFGGLLPWDVAIEARLDDGETLWRRLTATEVPWRAAYRSPAQREEALAAYCAQTLGFRPLASIDLAVPVVGLTGVAFLLPSPTSPMNNNTHRVYLKRMLVGAQVPGVLPPWAFFVRCVVDAASLRPTASREALYEDDVLLATRDALGRAVRDWVVQLLAEDSPLRRAFVSTHHLAIRSLALQDDDLLDLAARLLPYETTLGPMTLEEFREHEGVIRYAATVEDYRRVAPVARAQGLGIVNAGYVYDADLLARLERHRPDWRIHPLATQDVAARLSELAPADELSCLDFLLAASEPVRELGCELTVRSYSPAALPALLLTDADVEHQRALRRAQDEVDGLWGGLLDDFAEPHAERRLVLNFDNSTVQALVSTTDPEVRTAGVRSLYVAAQLLAGEPLRGREAEVMNESLATLLRRAAG